MKLRTAKKRWTRYAKLLKRKMSGRDRYGFYNELPRSVIARNIKAGVVWRQVPKHLRFVMRKGYAE